MNATEESIKYQEYFDRSRGIIQSLSDSSLTVNAVYDNKPDLYGAKHARIGSSISWIATKIGDNITIDLEKSYVVTGISTQGRANTKQWITEYRVETSQNGLDWIDQGRFRGNNDFTTVCTRKLSKPAVASFVRVTILKYNGHPSLRLDVSVFNF